MAQEKVLVNAVKIGRRFRKGWGDLRSLRASIRRLGVLNPILIDRQGNLIAGLRRLEASRAEGLEEIPARTVDLDDLGKLLAEQDENNEREPFSIEEKVQIAKAIEAKEKPEAAARQREHGGTAPGKPKNTPENFSQVISNGRAKDKAATAVGLSRPTLEKATEVVEAAEQAPENRDLVDKMNKTGKVSASHRELQTRNGKHEGKASKLPKAGSVVYDDRQITDLIGKLTRAIDARGNALGEMNFAWHTEMMNAMEGVAVAWKRAQAGKERKRRA